MGQFHFLPPRLLALSAFVLIVGGTLSAAAESFRVETPQGAMVEGVIDLPDDMADGPRPVIVIAPGAGYDMTQPLIAGFAGRATDLGMIAVRFNWNYFTQGTDRSADRATELEDLISVIDWALNDARTDRSQFILAGKSLGSIISYAASLKTSPAALYLLTPICRNEAEWRALYPAIAEGTVPLRLLFGAADPLCNREILYRGISARGVPPLIAVVPGGHSLELGTPEDTDRNVSIALDVLGAWLGEDSMNE